MAHRNLVRSLLGTLLVVATLSASAQPNPETMRGYVLGLLKKGAAWSEAADTARQGLSMRLLHAGVAVGAGSVFGDEHLFGVFMFASDSTSTVDRLLENDPSLRDSLFVMELHPWYAGRGIGEGLATARLGRNDSLPPMVSYQFGLLRRGAAWTPDRTPEVERLQKDHLANINRLAEEGKLVMAGPLMDNGFLRGVFVFQAGSLEEAERLSATDPAVRAGRLAVDLYDWRAPAGVFPAPTKGGQ